MKTYLNLLLLLCLFSTVQAEPLKEAQEAFQRGDYEQAIIQWQNVLTHNQSARFQAWLAIAQAHRYMGAYYQALDILNTAIPIAQQTKNRPYHALFRNELSKLRLSQGEKWFEQALEEGESAIKLARQSNRPEVLAEVLNNWGNILTADDDYEEAIEAYNEALQLSLNSQQLSKEDIQTLYSKILINQAKIFFLLDAEKASRRKKKPSFQASINALEKALQAIQSIESDSYNQVLGLITINQILQKMQKPLTDKSLTLMAYQALKTAREKAYRLENPLAKSFANGYLGALYEQAQRYQEALLLTRQAVFFAQQTREKPLMYLWQWQTARLLKAQGKNTEAITAYQQAITHLRLVRNKLVSTGYFKIVKSFREEIAPVYFELADLLLQQASLAPNQRDQRLQQAIKTIEFFKEAELQNYFQNDCANIAVTECTQIKDILDAETAVLYPISLSDRLELLLHRQEGLLQLTVNISDKRLRKEILSVLSHLRRHPYYKDFARGSPDNQIVPSCTPSMEISVDKIAKPNSTLLKGLKTLHSWLIQPLLPQLNQINTLIIVPDGALRTIPFAALHDGEQFLIEQYALAITPGLCLSQPQAIKPKEKTILLSGLSEAVQGFSELPCAKSELETLQQFFEPTNNPLLLNRQFTVPTLQKELAQKGHSIVHIASHGQFSGSLEKTFILTYDDKLSLNKLEQLMSLATITGKPIELLTLSACETAVGDDRAALGLAGVALKAGVKSALASLWKVDDIATQAIIIEFYRQLQNGHSKAKALQKAQSMMLTDKRYATHQHPYFWSAFLLIGNWF
jgi:CHAT domain-containing protein